MFAVLEKALSSGAAKAADRKSGQRGLFDDVEEEEVIDIDAVQLEIDALEKATGEANKYVMGLYA